MIFLQTQPVWQVRALSDDEIHITNTLWRIYEGIFYDAKLHKREIEAVKKSLGKEKIWTFKGRYLDGHFKAKVESAIANGSLPQSLHVTKPGLKGPDIWMDDVAWDLTTAEQGEYHVNRDVLRDERGWSVYFVLGY